MKSLLLLLVCAAAAGAQAYDLAVYGGTAGGAITAVSGARMGLKTLLLEPREHIGGMVSGGLSRTDVGKREIIGGYSLEFYWRAGNAYDMAQYLQDIAWLVEPHVAEAIFRQMLADAGVTVLFNQRLREKDGVRKSAGRIQSIAMENGAQYAARMFADCTYEGDLMAQAGVTYTWGRESSAEYGESLAGVRGETPFHQFLVDLSPKGAGGKLLPEISGAPAAAPGSADRMVQAYNFRMILSHDPANQVAYPKPAHYDPARFELFARLLDAMQKKQGRPARLGEVLSVIAIPNQKADIAKCFPSSRSPTRRPTSTTTGLFPRITSARAGTIPTPATRAARKSGVTTRSTSRSSSGSWRTTRACRPRCKKRLTSGGSPRTSSWIPVTGPTSYTSAKRAAWWAST